MSKTIQRILAIALIVATLFSLAVTAHAATINDGNSNTVTVVAGNRVGILQTAMGNTISGQGWTYTTDDGIVGPAYCVNWGLNPVSPTKELPISGRYYASPKTMGAFANGYPQFTLDAFLELYLGTYPELAGLTETEYAYATQVAVWSTLGQLAVEGTAFTTGRSTIVKPSNDAQKIRTFKALEIILEYAQGWTTQLHVGMYLRTEEAVAGNTLDLGVVSPEEAAEQNLFGIKKETIGGVEYYTRKFIAASATSTYFHDHFIDVWAENAPAGTIFTDLSNQPLETVVEGVTKWKAPSSTTRYTTLNANEIEWYSEFKICIPVEDVPANGEITIRMTSTVRQYNMYLANNTAENEQSYIIADPVTTVSGSFGFLKWMETPPEFGAIVLIKTDTMGNLLPGAKFTLEGPETRTGVTDSNGRIVWNNLAPGNYTVRETEAPAGFVLAAPVNVTVVAEQTSYVTVRNSNEAVFHLKKTDAQNGNPLYGAVFEFQQIDGDYHTTAVTGYDGIIYFIGGELPYGSYEVTELQAPNGYEPDTQKQTLHWDGTQNITLTFQNVRKMGFTIFKRDADTGAPLAGARFAIYKDGTLITTAESDYNGIAQISGLSAGYYEVAETVAPSGYVLDTTRHGIYINPYNPATTDDPVLIIDNSAKPSLRITKYDAATMSRISGCVFEVWCDANLLGTYTTNAIGEILLTDLAPGTYLVKEIAAPGSYLVNSTPQQIELTAGGGTASLVFLNDAKPGIRIVKLDSETLAPLRDAVFTISRVGGSYTREAVTNASGEIVLGDLDPGVYHITETAAPSGYVADNAVRVFEVQGGESAVLTFTNTQKPSLVVEKRDAMTGEKLSGATIRVSKVDDPTWYRDMTTGTDGTFTLPLLDPGLYSVRELIAPGGYLLNATEHHVKLTAGETSRVTISNPRQPDLRIVKYDAQTMKPLAGVTFEVYRDTTLIGTYTTNSSGEIHLSGLQPGTYLVQEIAAPDSHVVNSTPQQIEVVAGETATLVFLNQLKPGIHLVKLDSQTMLPLVNAKFRISKIGGGFSKEYATDQNGEINLSTLEPGAYIVEEIAAPSGYLIDDAIRTVQINPGENAVFVFTNTKKPTLEIVKYDPVADRYLGGATFRIAKIEDGSHYLDRITDVDGRISIDGLDPGIYSVKELAAPSGYVLNPTEYHVELFPGRTSQLVVVNEQKPNLFIYKTDAISGEPIEGAQFTVRKADGPTLTTVSTNARGEALLVGLDPGVYTITEVSVPDGYLLDDTPQQITLVPGETGIVRFQNYPKPILLIHKRDAITKDPIQHTKFHIVYASNNTFSGEVNDLGYYYTDASGNISLSKLKDGWYRIAEVEPAAGYAIKEPATQTVYIAAGSGKTVTFENTPLSALVIRKVDSGTGLPVQGAAFRVRYLGGTSGSGGTIIHEGVTSANGTIVLTSLAAGTYTVEEYRAAPGYELSNPSTQTAYLSGKDQDVVTLEFSNAKKGEVLIQKLDSATKQPLKGAQFKVTDSSGAVVGANNGIFITDAGGLINLTEYLPVGSTVVVQEIVAPSGYVLDTTVQTLKIKENTAHLLTFYNTAEATPGGLTIVKSDEDSGARISGARFEVRRQNGEIIGYYTTDKSGVIRLRELESGWYVVTETRAADGYLLDATPHSVQVRDGRTATLEVQNRAKSGILIRKVDSVTGQGIYGVSFLLSDSGNNPVGQYTTDQIGIVLINDSLTAGRYYLRELSAAPGYLADTQVKTVYVEAGKTTQVTWENTPAMGQIIITKLSSDYNAITNLPAESPLAGAVFEVRTLAGNLVDTITSDSRGIAATKPLAPNVYTVTEVTPPPYYTGTTQSLTAQIRNDGDIVQFTVYNRSVSLGVTVQKRGNNQVQGGQTMRYDLYNVGNISSVQLDNFYLHDRLPTDAVRITKLFTGTWSQRLTYSVYFKTNYNDYRILASGLQSHINYDLSLHPTSLGLMSGEYVTDVRWEFGTVSAGFKEVQNPFLFVEVLTGLAKDYQIINRADVGGSYLGEWQTARTTWLTTIFGNPTPLPTLPKTGY